MKQKPQTSHLGLNNLNRMSDSAAISYVIGWLCLGGKKNKRYEIVTEHFDSCIFNVFMWFPTPETNYRSLFPLSFPSQICLMIM